MSFRCLIVDVVPVIFQVVANLAPDHKADAFSPSPADCTGKVDCTIRLFLDGFHKWDARYFVYIAEHG